MVTSLVLAFSVGLIVLGQLLSLGLAYCAVPFWVKKDVAQMKADAGNDSLHLTFHRQRLSWRLGFVAVQAVGCSLPWLLLEHGFGSFCWSCLGLVATGAAYFFYGFNPQLNVGRRAIHPWITEVYYVSADPRAAWWPDRLLWAHACRQLPALRGQAEDDPVLYAARKAHTAQELKLLGYCALLAGAMVYFMATVFAVTII